MSRSADVAMEWKQSGRSVTEDRWASAAGLLCRWSARLIVAGVFIVAAWHKLADPAAFALAIHRYQILPDVLIHPLAIMLPWLEVVAAGALLTTRRWRCAGSVVIAGLLLVFMIAAGSAWARGLNVSCGCFSAGADDSPVGVWLFIRNGLLITATIIGTWGDWQADRFSGDPPKLSREVQSQNG